MDPAGGGRAGGAGHLPSAPAGGGRCGPRRCSAPAAARPPPLLGPRRGPAGLPALRLVATGPRSRLRQGGEGGMARDALGLLERTRIEMLSPKLRLSIHLCLALAASVRAFPSFRQDFLRQKLLCRRLQGHGYGLPLHHGPPFSLPGPREAAAPRGRWRLPGLPPARASVAETFPQLKPLRNSLDGRISAQPAFGAQTSSS